MVAKFGSPKEIIASAQSYAKKHAPQYALFAEKWVKAMRVLGAEELSTQVTVQK